MALDRRQLLLGLGALTLAACHGSSQAVSPDLLPPPPPRDPIPTPPPPELTDDALARWREALGRARNTQSHRLDTYATRRRFPKNHRFFGRVPVFIDEHGTPCAVGYLMIESGWRDAARAVAATANHVYIETLRSGPVVDWILRSGLTQEECAAIQPQYSCEMRPECWNRLPEAERLERHFRHVQDRLSETKPESIAKALARLGPAIARGLRVDQLVA